MNQILIIAHQPLAEALRLCAMHVFPDCGDRVHALDVPPHEPRDTTLERVRQVLQANGHTPTLLLTDIVGATPCNVLTNVLDYQAADEVRAISGVNMPMLLRALSYASLPLPDMQQRALDGGVHGIQALACPNPKACYESAE